MRRLTTTLAALLLACGFFGCKTPEKTATAHEDFVCREEPQYHLNNRSEFARCMKIAETDFGNYFFYEKQTTAPTDNDINSASRVLRSAIADQIVAIIVMRLEQEFGQSIMTNWQLESTSLPVTFRTFQKFDGTKYEVKVVAAFEKSNLTTRSLIRFLPLEYKMQLMSKPGQDYRLR